MNLHWATLRNATLNKNPLSITPLLLSFPQRKPQKFLPYLRWGESLSNILSHPEAQIVKILMIRPQLEDRQNTRKEKVINRMVIPQKISCLTSKAHISNTSKVSWVLNMSTALKSFRLSKPKTESAWKTMRLFTKQWNSKKLLSCSSKQKCCTASWCCQEAQWKPERCIWRNCQFFRRLSTKSCSIESIERLTLSCNNLQLNIVITVLSNLNTLSWK